MSAPSLPTNSEDSSMAAVKENSNEHAVSAKASVANGASAEQKPTENSTRKPKNDSRNAGRDRMKRLNQIHNSPLPLAVYPLPVFHPTNPLSLLQLAYVLISQFLAPPSSHSIRYIGYLSLDTRSIHVTDDKQVRALWEMGFFGKGLLSRSEPTWLDAMQRAGVTAEERRAGVREQRRAFKLHRAREQREKIEKQKAVEEGRLDTSELERDSEIADSADAISSQDRPAQEPAIVAHAEPVSSQPILSDDSRIEAVANAIRPPDTVNHVVRRPQEETQTGADEDGVPDKTANQEHLQLSFEEAFFLIYALGILEVVDGPHSWEAASRRKPGTSPESVLALLQCFCNRSFFPPRDPSYTPKPDDQFLLNYVTYHHFRSLGWVPRSGIKFAVDYLIYNRGPPFSHAEFGIIIVPSYSAPYWNTEDGKQRRRVKGVRDWRWLHCMNRVQTTVFKTLVLCYVEIPQPDLVDPGDIGKLLRSYKVREFAIQRWSGNRNRG